MRRIGFSLPGCLISGAAVFALGMALPSVIAISQAEGAYAMGVALVWTPLARLVGAVAGLVLSGERAMA